MAFAATTHWDVRSGGADGTTGNGGGFDTNATFATDLAATSGTGTAPVVTSASYNFVAGDVGHWVFIKSGTNWLPGWYAIASVAANAATLTATIGAGVDFTTYRPTTVAGVASVASPTGGSWAIDYSQTTAAGIAYTDIAFGVTTTTCTSAGKPFGPNVVGNVIAIASGTNFTVQRVQIASISGTTITVDKSLGTNPGSGGTGNLGGALATPGQAGALMVGGNTLWVKAATYSCTSATANIASGMVSLPAGASATAMTRMIGWNSVRGDGGTKPLLQASGAITTFTIVTGGAVTHIENIAVDAVSKTTSTGFNLTSGQSRCVKCKASNCTANAFNGSSTLTLALLCEATGCSGNIFIYNVTCCIGCTAHDNTGHGFLCSVALFCVASNNTGTRDGFRLGASTRYINCVSYGNGQHGFNHNAVSSPQSNDLINCIAVNNSGYGFTANTASDMINLVNCAGFNNTSGLVNNAVIGLMNQIGLITLTADPFAGAASNNFALNNAAAGGALLRAAGIPGASTLPLPGLSTLNYLDVGAVQQIKAVADLINGSLVA